jgi:hypothetical protein
VPIAGLILQRDRTVKIGRRKRAPRRGKRATAKARLRGGLRAVVANPHRPPCVTRFSGGCGSIALRIHSRDPDHPDHSPGLNGDPRGGNGAREAAGLALAGSSTHL